MSRPLSEWKPGGVGLIDARIEDSRVMFTGDAWISASGEALNRYLQPRPLVVIDPEDREQAERLLIAFKWPKPLPGYAVDDMQAALREFANPTPPRPEEPTGLGAVVEDADGARWVRNADPFVACKWRNSEQDWRPWSDIAAVRVLSEGVQP